MSRPGGLLALAALVALPLACSPTRRTPPPAPPPPPVRDAVVAPPPAVARPPDVAAVTADAAADAERVVTAEERLLRAVASGATPVADVIDPARGVVLIHHVEAPPSGRGRADISTRRLCGAALVRASPSLRRELGQAVEQADHMEGMECTREECTVAGMEWTPAWHVLFVAGDGGAPRVESIALVSEATMGDEWLQRARAYVDRGLAAARQRPCAAR